VRPAQSYVERRDIIAPEKHISSKCTPSRTVHASISVATACTDSKMAHATGRAPEWRHGGKPQRQTATSPKIGKRNCARLVPSPQARAVDAIFSADDAGREASPEQWKELTQSRKAFDQVRPHGWQDVKAATGRDIDPESRADRFWNAGTNSTMPVSANIRKAICPATRPPGR
jgi:hypothetical protein